jgi:hypothetical protein
MGALKMRYSLVLFHHPHAQVWDCFWIGGRVILKGIRKEQARANTTIDGDEKLGEKMLDTVSIIA